jgi:hypothetical protein
VAVALLLAGCAGMGFRSAAGELLGRADSRMAAADYRGAAELYGRFVDENPGDPAAARARATRTLLQQWLQSQADLDRLKAENSRLRADLERLTADNSRLRADLERLRKIDLRPTPAPR